MLLKQSALIAFLSRKFYKLCPKRYRSDLVSVFVKVLNLVENALISGNGLTRPSLDLIVCIPL